jgi:hypothetical protein
MNLSGGTRDMVTWKPVAGAHDARHRAERKASMLGLKLRARRRAALAGVAEPLIGTV